MRSKGEYVTCGSSGGGCLGTKGLRRDGRNSASREKGSHSGHRGRVPEVVEFKCDGWRGTGVPRVS